MCTVCTIVSYNVKRTIDSEECSVRRNRFSHAIRIQENQIAGLKINLRALGKTVPLRYSQRHRSTIEYQFSITTARQDVARWVSWVDIIKCPAIKVESCKKQREKTGPRHVLGQSAVCKRKDVIDSLIGERKRPKI